MSAPVKKSVRLSGATVRTLKAISFQPLESSVNWSGSINELAEHYESIMSALSKGVLNDEQWQLLIHCYKGHTPHPIIEEEAKLLPWIIENALQSPGVIEMVKSQSVAISPLAAKPLIEQLTKSSIPVRCALIHQLKAIWVLAPAQRE